MVLKKPLSGFGKMPPIPNFFSIVLAGGSGTRLWPLSRGQMPKHLLPLTGVESLLQQAIRRLISKIPAKRTLTVIHESHLPIIHQQLAAIDPVLAERILAEPVANNTLPAIAWGVAEIARVNPEAIVGVFPADHQIGDTKAFLATIAQAFEAAEQDSLVTIGIKPTGPETGYGYIQAAGNKVLSFVEKPSREKAEEYLRSGNYYWNAGMFVFKGSLFLEELKCFEPTIYDAVQRIANALSAKKGAMVREEYARMKKISVDYGIMEKSKRVAVVPATFGWNDLGSWESVYETGKKDGEQNVTQGEVISVDSSSSLLLSKEGVLAAIGLKDMVVIQTGDAVLVCPRDRSQEVKKIVDELKRRKHPVIESGATDHRPWGNFTVLEEGAGFKVKRIVVNPGQKLSLQRHKKRSENWVIIEGVARVMKGDKEVALQLGESIFIAAGEKHRLENPGKTPLAIIEVQTGPYLGEDDIERFDDVYGRK